MTSLGPFILSTVFFIFWFIYYLATNKGALFKDAKVKSKFWIHNLATFVIVSFALHPQIVELSFTAFKCVNLGDDENPETYLEADTDIKCWDGNHLKYALMAALPSIIIWGKKLRIPVFSGKRIFKLREN